MENTLHWRRILNSLAGRNKINSYIIPICSIPEGVVAFQGNILTKYPVRKIAHLEVGQSTLGACRLAVPATGEYTQKHNGTKEGALAAINTTLNRIIFVLESEVAVTLELIENNDSLIFTDGTTDPFTNGNASTMALENNNFLTANLGLANFDVGHVFGTNCNIVVGVSGGIGIVCGSLKGFG